MFATEIIGNFAYIDNQNLYMDTLWFSANIARV